MTSRSRICNGALRSREVDNTVVAEAIQRGEVVRPKCRLI
jgi:hypothetical protein